MGKNKSNNLPEIDLSLVSFNSARWIDKFFLSLSSQHFPTNKINVLVRDNGSTDETLILLEKIRIREMEFASFHVESGSNVGFGPGHNDNMARGKAPYFLVSNLDLAFEPDAIPRIVTQALSDDSTVASWEFRQKPYEHPKYYNPVSMLTLWSSGACILFRRESIMRVGGYEPRIFMYGEDAELSYRLRSEGFVLKYYPKAVCWHYSYETANEVKPMQFVGSKLGVAYLRMRYGSWWQIFEVAPLFLATLFLPQRFSGQRRSLLKVIKQLFRNAPYFLSTRKNTGAKTPFKKFDCGSSRMGAFYENRSLPANPPLVSIIIRTCQGRLPFLKEAISSVINQTYPNIELIVIENGATTAEIYLQEIADRNILTSIQYISLEMCRRSKAGNAGLVLASGEYTCFLNDDALFFADHIEVLVEEILPRNSIKAAFGGTAQILDHHLFASDIQPPEFHLRSDNAHPFNREMLVDQNYIPIQAVLFSMSLYKKYGGFNEELKSLESWELWLRYSITNEFSLVPKLTSLYRVPEHSTKETNREKLLIQKMPANTDE